MAASRRNPKDIYIYIYIEREREKEIRLLAIGCSGIWRLRTWGFMCVYIYIYIYIYVHTYVCIQHRAQPLIDPRTLKVWDFTPKADMGEGFETSISYLPYSTLSANSVK